MKKKIMITGASGVGKTTLATHMAEVYETPFLTSSASEVWPEFGWKTHAEAHRESTLSKYVGIKYQWAILQRRLFLLSNDCYITDRSPIDNMAYIMMQLGHSLIRCEVMDFIKECNKGMTGVDGLIFIRWNGKINLEDNGKRIMNDYYQAMVDAVIQWVINDLIVFRTCPILELTGWDFETRITQVDEWIRNL